MRTHALLLTLCLIFLVAPAFGQDKAKLPGLIQKLQSGSDAEKLTAAVALADFGPDAAPATTVLAAALQAKSEDLRLNAAIALGKIGTPAVGPVAKLLASDKASDRYYAIWTLGWIGTAASQTAPQVIQALADKDEGVRRKAAYTLGRIAPDAKIAIPALIKTFADANSEVRQAAADALSKFGPAAVPPLIDALKADSASTRSEAARALGTIGSDARDAIPALKALFLASDKVGNSAGEALAKIGKPAVPALSEALKHDNAAVRAQAVRLLGKIGADAVPTLVDALADKNVDVRLGAAGALTPLRISDKMVVLALAHAVHDPDQRVRQQCLQALRLLGVGAKLAAPKLIAALKDSDGANRLQIIQVLQGLGETDQILPVAAELLGDGNAQIRLAAVGLLGSQGSKALPYLITALKDSEATVRFTAVRTIQTLPGDVKEALPALTPLLKDGNNVQRRVVVLLLARMGEPAVPHLMGFLKEADNLMRSSAVVALGNVGPDAKKAVPALSEIALQDTYAIARRNAVLAVASIEPEKLTDLFDNVKKQNEPIRLTAYQALSFRVGKKGVAATLPAKLALPHLIDATKDASANIRLLGVQGINGLGAAAAKDAAPALMALLNDPDPRVRTQAQQTLNQIKGK